MREQTKSSRSEDVLLEDLDFCKDGQANLKNHIFQCDQIQHDTVVRCKK